MIVSKFVMIVFLFSSNGYATSQQIEGFTTLEQCVKEAKIVKGKTENGWNNVVTTCVEVK